MLCTAACKHSNQKFNTMEQLILNPTQHTFETRLKPLLNEAHALISKLNLR